MSCFLKHMIMSVYLWLKNALKCFSGLSRLYYVLRENNLHESIRYKKINENVTNYHRKTDKFC